MDIKTLFITALIAGFSGALMPGPLLTMTINYSVRKGPLMGPLLMVGHALLELILIIILLLGFDKFLQQPIVGGIIGLIGGAFLIWMGYDMFKTARRGKISLNFETDQGGDQMKFHPIIAGAVTSISNPYWTLWWASAGTAFLQKTVEGQISRVAAFYFGHISADFIWYSTVAFAVAAGRKIMNDTVYRGIIAVCGLFLIGLGGWFVYSGWGFLKLL